MTILPQTLPDLVIANASNDNGDRSAVVDDTGRRLTYRELLHEAAKFCDGLRQLGIGPRSVVGLLAPNSTDWIVSLLGAQMCGATVAAFHTWVKAHEMKFLLTHSEAELLVMGRRVGDRDLLEPVRELIPEIDGNPVGSWRSGEFPRLRTVVLMGDGIGVPVGVVPQDQLVTGRQETASKLYPSDPSDVAVVLYTSGSTAHPKGVPLIQGDMVRNGFEIGERMGLGPDDRVWLGSPLFWSFGVANALVAALTHQATLVVQEKFNARQAALQIQRESCTAAYLLPAMTYSFLEIPNIADEFSTVRTGLTIGRKEEIEMVVEGLGIKGICNVYGSTETYGNCCVTPFDMPLEQRLRCQGTPLPGFEIRIVDDATGQDLPAGQPGAVFVRGRVTPGYVKAPELNEETFIEDGWYRSGDIGFLDQDGAFTFVTRDTDMIKTNGINVSPAEIEEFVASDPSISEVVVVGVPDQLKGQAIAAVVRLSPGSHLTEDEIIARCKDQLAAYKVPHSVHIVSEIPLTATGKLSRRSLIEVIVGRAALETDEEK